LEAGYVKTSFMNNCTALSVDAAGES